MIDAYLVMALVVGIVLSFLGLIHHFWLRHVFAEEAREQAGKISKPERTNIRTTASEIERSNTYESNTTAARPRPEHLAGQHNTRHAEQGHAQVLH